MTTNMAIICNGDDDGEEMPMNLNTVQMKQMLKTWL